jgi:hypothetical protein
MKKYKFCPKCSQPLEDDGTCPGCTYGHKRQQQAKHTQQPRLCAFNDHGDSCRQPGHLSTGTIGTGPWYCRAHFAKIMKWPAWEATTEKPLSIAVEEITKDLKEPYRTRALKAQAIAAAGDGEPMSEVDKRVNRLVPKLDGESEHAWSMRCRDWTINQLGPKLDGAMSTREPGED